MLQNVNNKGNWEFSFFQKSINLVEESNIKLLLKPENSFNPKNINKYINKEFSKEELILIKKNKGEKLKNTETIILKNYLDKNTKNIKNDIDLIKKYNINAKPITNEGKIRLLLTNLNILLEKNNIEGIVNIYLKLLEDQFKITSDIEKEYSKEIEYMKKIVTEVDLIKLQFTKFYSQMPPLNENGFKKFDNWQIEIINNIDNNISTIINAPTSAGKSILSGYASIKGRIIYVVPTDALAWQISAYLGNILNENIPLLTDTYQTNPSRDNMIEVLNKASAIVGTPDIIVDYLPFIKNNFKWLICDEVHMISKIEGSSMEYIIKLLFINNNVCLLGLSATIKNTDFFLNWLKNISPEKEISKIICNKRFFNLQKFYYDNKNDNIVSIHPLSLFNSVDFENGSILNKTIDATPPTVWDLALKLKDLFDLKELDPYNYFNINIRIELSEVYIYFNKLINFMVVNYNEKIKNILDDYKNIIIDNNNLDLVKLAFKLKNEKKTPVIIFNKNTNACLKQIFEFAKNIDNLENNKYPKLFNERIKILKNNKKIEKKIDIKLENDSKKSMKMMLTEETNISDPLLISLQEPHEDFILNDNQFFSDFIVEKWVNDLKKYFPNTGEYYHFIIKLLWRGVGIYAKGLPDPYLRLVQSLANSKQLAIVFSDKSLVFGISMPFRSVVILNDNKYKDNLESMLFNQMIGRAGRRGLDKEGNIIFAGYTWERIKELSISDIPNIEGNNDLFYSTLHANKLSKLYNTDQNWDKIFSNILSETINYDIVNDFISNLNNNYINSWDFGYNDNNINHLYMNWKFRNSKEGIIISYLLPFLEKEFENKDHTLENNQINLAYFLANFIEIKINEENNEIFPIKDYNKDIYIKIKNDLNNVNINIHDNIDNKLFLSIQSNKINIDTNDISLRKRLFNFGNKLKNIQHYYFYNKITNLTKLFGKLLTRIWWIYHTSSPIMKSLHNYE